jgi:DNA-binding MarR family transcriptional regulator
MTDMSDIPALLKKARAKRDSIVRRLLAAGRGPTEIGKELGVTRQRAQQIIKRLDNGKP